MPEDVLHGVSKEAAAVVIGLISGDLMTLSSLQGPARQRGVLIRAVGGPGGVAELLNLPDLQAWVLDLQSATSPASLPAMTEGGRPLFRIAYGPHVHVERMQNAREAGFDIVWPRGRFLSDWPQLLDQILKHASSTTHIPNPSEQ